MEARDKERLDRMAKEATELAAANAAKKKKAEERIAGAGRACCALCIVAVHNHAVLPGCLLAKMQCCADCAAR